MFRPYQIEINMTLAGAAIGATIGLPSGLWQAFLGLVIGALIPVPGLLLFSFLLSSILQFFFGKDEEETAPQAEDPTTKSKVAAEEGQSDL